MSNILKRITSVLLSSAVLYDALMFSGCDTMEKKSSGIVSLPRNDSSTSAASASTSDATVPLDEDTVFAQKNEPNDVSENAVYIRSLSEALANFSEIENKAAEGTPEEIVKTLLERNILCYATLQGKCWTYDEAKYSSNYEFSNGIVPIRSDYISSTYQIDDLFYSTYTEETADYFIHYDDGDDVYDAFSYNGVLCADFSQILKTSLNSFEMPTYAAVVSASDHEIVFERFSVPYTVEGAPSPNNYRFRAINERGRWRLENYIIDVPSYSRMYSSLIQTARKGNPDIEKIAMAEVGNFGGEPYWDWYGYGFRIEWCAAFVSWCYYMAGADEPHFIAVNSEGIPWFKDHGQWADADYRDIAPGDCIFMDWENDGKANHVGLVIGTDGEKVYTIEGNRSDACQAFAYDLDDPRIFGYGLMNWD